MAAAGSYYTAAYQRDVFPAFAYFDAETIPQA